MADKNKFQDLGGLDDDFAGLEGLTDKTSKDYETIPETETKKTNYLNTLGQYWSNTPILGKVGIGAAGVVGGIIILPHLIPLAIGSVVVGGAIYGINKYHQKKPQNKDPFDDLK